MQNIIILYHGNCPDGLAGAYAAWKKFGAAATYLPVTHGDPMPGDLEGKEVYIIDFSYPNGILLQIEKGAKRLVVLDHHISAKSWVEAVREHVFKNDRSGAGIAWEYFHPGTPLPRVLAYIEDNDLWRHSLPDYDAFASYLGTVNLSLETLDTLVRDGEDDAAFGKMIASGRVYAAYNERLNAALVDLAEEVEFDGYTILAVNAPRMFRSKVGHLLAVKHPPFSVVWYEKEGKRHYSLRGDGSIDVSQIAAAHGGGGHHNAAGFETPADAPPVLHPTKSHV